MSINPLILTYFRLAHRGGVWPLVAIALTAGGLIVAYIHYRPEVALSMFTLWTIFEGLIVCGGAAARIGFSVGREYREGLLESNRLTPMSPHQLVLGYMLGPPARTWCIALTMTAVSIVLVVVGHGQITWKQWLISQGLLAGAAAMATLWTLVLSLTMHGGGFIATVAVCASLLGSADYGNLSILNFIVPIQPLTQLLNPPAHGDAIAPWVRHQYDDPTVFGYTVPGAALALAVHLFLGVMAWRAAAAKFRDPQEHAFTHATLPILAAGLIGLQNGLVWQQVHEPTRYVLAHPWQILSLVHAVTLVFILWAVGFNPLRETQMRRMVAARQSVGQALAVGSAVSVALLLGLIAAAAIAAHAYVQPDWQDFSAMVVAINLITAPIHIAAIVETVMLRFRERFQVILGLCLFVLLVLPLLAAVLFSKNALAWLSPLGLGIAPFLLGYQNDIERLRWFAAGHAATAMLLLAVWAMIWMQWTRQCRQQTLVSRDHRQETPFPESPS